MPETETYEQKLAGEFSRRGVQPKCEACGHVGWAITAFPVALNIDDLAITHSNPSARFPAALVICENCGNMRLHALSVLGMLAPGAEEGTEDAE